MSALTPNAQVSFLELAKRTTDKGMIAIAEVMKAKTPILEDVPWFQCNQILSEKINRRATLPEGTFRQAYQGVTKAASTTQVIVEPTALIEARSEIDEDIVDNAPNPSQLRRDEDMSFVEGLSQQMAEKFIAGTITGSPEQFNGLQPRLNALSQRTVIDGGGTSSGAMTSIYVVNWGKPTVYGIYPSAAANRGRLGLSVINKGKEKLLDGSNNPYYGYVTQFKWWVGLAVRDEFAIGRIANIMPSGTSNIFDEDDLIELLNEGHFNRATTRIYFNSKIATQAQIRLKNKGNVNWAATTVGLSGIPVLSFDGCVCRLMEDNVITNTETTVA